jgi:ribosomal protein S18 acetylase RimI-like enzyme
MPAPNVYYSAISLAPAATRRAGAASIQALRPHLADRSAGVVSVCDNWDDLDLRALGLHRRTAGRWLAREAAAPPHLHRIDLARTVSGAGLRIERVTDRDTLATFERTMVAGFGARPPIGPFAIHGAAILDDPAMHVLAGWLGDELVACSMTYVTDVAGIYGVATLPAWRRQGLATAMTTAALAVAPDRVAVLQPTAAAGALYDHLGFEEVGRFSHWA